MPGPPKENMHDRGRPSLTLTKHVSFICAGATIGVAYPYAREEEREKRKKEES